MTLTAHRTTPSAAVTAPAVPHLWRRVRAGLRRHRVSLAYAVPLMALAGVVSRVNMSGAPQRIDDEGTYTAQAYAVDRFGELTHYTYWYDHPPLGWLQIAAWTRLTDAFDRYDVAVIAGREAMVVAHVVTVGLLWLLARRLGLSRPGALGAGLVYALSPLAVQFTRTVYLDNLATPWMVAAFVLALSRRHQLVSFAGSAACFGMAALSKETFLLLLPFLVWQMWRSSSPSTRRYTISVAASLLVLVLASYGLFALVKGEVVPGANRVSLVDGIRFQLLSREGSGSLLDASSQAGRSVRVWLTLDPVTPVAALVATVAGLFVRRLRPLAAALAFSFLVVLKPGYLPVPYVIVLLPFSALMVAGVVDLAVRHRGRGRRVATVSAVVASLAAAAVAAPLWAVQLRGLWLADLDEPMRDAQTWIAGNVDRDERVLVDDAVWVDLVQDGFPRENVVWYYKADTDPAVQARSPNGWQDYDWVLVTQALRRNVRPGPTVQQALDNGVTRASFGQGEQRVSVVEVRPEGTEVAKETADRNAAARTRAGRILADNPRLQLSPDARSALYDGQVDSRLLTLLASLTGDHRLTVTGFPAVPGEDGLGPLRRVTISSVDGSPVGSAAGQQLLASARAAGTVFRPEVRREGGVVTLSFEPGAPSDLLPAAP